MNNKSILFVLVICANFLISEKLNTAWGVCEINIYGNSKKHSDSFNNLILNTCNELSAQYGNIYMDKFNIYITDNLSDYHKYAVGYTPNWGIAVTKKYPDRIIIQGPEITKKSSSKLYDILKHELNHIYVNRINNSSTLPSWFKEGFAMMTANEFSVNHKISISKAILMKNLFSFNDLENFSNVNEINASLAYSQSAAFINGLVYFFGEDIFLNLFKNMSNDLNFQQSIELITNSTIEQIQIKLLDYIENKYNLIFLLEMPNLIFSIVPIILLFGFLYKRIQNKKKLVEWEMEEQNNIENSLDNEN